MSFVFLHVQWSCFYCQESKTIWLLRFSFNLYGSKVPYLKKQILFFLLLWHDRWIDWYWDLFFVVLFHNGFFQSFKSIYLSISQADSLSVNRPQRRLSPFAWIFSEFPFFCLFLSVRYFFFLLNYMGKIWRLSLSLVVKSFSHFSLQ